MTTTIKRSRRKHTPKQKKNLTEMAVAFLKQTQPAHDSILKKAEILAEQNKAMNNSLEQFTQSIKIPKFIFDIPIIDTSNFTNNFEIYSETINQAQKFEEYLAPMLKNIERIKTDFHKNFPVFPTIINPEIFNAGEVRRVKAEPRIDWTYTEEVCQKPMHPSDAAMFERIEIGIKSMNSVPKIEESSIYCRKTMSLKIDETTIKLTSNEKNICNFVFWDSSIRVFNLEELEEAIYGDIASASDKLKQALKRINEKIKEADGSKLFSYSEGLLSILI